MNLITMSLNIVVLILVLGGCLFFLIVAWKSMKALETISNTLKKMCEKS